MNWKALSVLLIILLLISGIYIIYDLFKIKEENEINNGESVRVINITVENFHLNRYDYDPLDEYKTYDSEREWFQPNATLADYEYYSGLDLRFDWNLIILNSTGSLISGSYPVENGIITSSSNPPYTYGIGELIESKWLTGENTGLHRNSTYTFYLQIVIFKDQSIVYMPLPTELSIET